MGTAVQTVRENEREQVVMLSTQVAANYTAVQHNQLDFSELHESIMQLEQFILSHDHDDEAAAAILQGLTPEMTGSLNDAYCFWQTRHEHDFAQRLCKEQASLSDYLLNKRFAALIERELSLVSNARLKRILFIGNGPLLISAMLLHTKTGLPVDCVVEDAATIPAARQALHACGLSESVRILADNKLNHDVFDYDLVVIGLLTKSKKTFLKTLRKRCRPGSQILCRTSFGLRRLFYEPIADRHLRGFHFKGQQVANGTQTISTWLLEAAGSAAADVRLEWVRRIDSDMATQLLRLMNKTLEEETTIGFPGPIDEETGYALMRQLNADVESDHRHVLVAYKGGTVVGQLILTPNSSPNHRHIVELTRGTIDPSFRGGGLALRAFQEVAKKCEELGREVICLDVRAGTHAAIWWQHFGFKQYGLLPDYSRVGDKRYQGLYLTQTTVELKERVAQLAKMGPSANLFSNQ
jgi:ribosomal protein S18 acetylase RimI-like enzyme